MRLPTRRRLPSVAALLLAASPLAAEEGMWMPQQIRDLAPKLREMGFEGAAAAFADLTGQPMGAVVSLGGCTASFVSPDGLVVTNHHCATGALQYNSTPERNLLREGFLARTREDELSNGPGARVFVTVSFGDETAPAEGIGNFGGETDNWRWPRHTGDWSFFRAYVGKDGKPAPYSKDNVPYRPERWLRVQSEGIEAGDLVFVVGYPGRTERHQTYVEVKQTTEWAFPRAIRTSEAQIAILEALTREDKALEIKAAARLRGLHNSLTNRKGMLEGLVSGGILAKKEAAEKALRAWLAPDPPPRGVCGAVLPALHARPAGGAR